MKRSFCSISIAAIRAFVIFFASSLPAAADQQLVLGGEVARYDLAGRVTGTIKSFQDPHHGVIHLAERYQYDARGLLVVVQSGNLSTWQDESVKPEGWTGFSVHQQAAKTYNELGLLETETTEDGAGNKYTLTQYSYDQYERLECQAVRMNPAAYSALPDACAQGVAGDYGPDRITRYEYNTIGKLTKEKRAVGTPLEQTYKAYVYDTANRPETVTDANLNTTRYAYDSKNRQTHWYFPSKIKGTATASTTDFEQYGYDDNGNRTSLRKRDGRVINYIYDDLNRVVIKDIPGSTSNDVYYDYSLTGQELYVRFGSESGAGITRNFDGFGRLRFETNTSSGTSRTIESQYDDNGNRTHVYHPDGEFFAYNYNQMDSLVQIQQGDTEPLIDYRLDNKGRLDELYRDNGTATAVNYDPISRMSGFGHALLATNSSVAFDYQYNSANQLTSLVISNGLYHHPNRQKGSRGVYVQNGLNQYTTLDNKSFEYDDNGNLTGYDDRVFQYDVENRLAHINGDESADLRYDPAGRINTLTIDGVTTEFLYDGDSLIAEYRDGELTNRYVFGMGIDQPLVQYQGSVVTDTNRHFLHANHQGSVVAASDGVGGLAYINRYDEYGVADQGNQGRFGYTGQLNLDGLGLQYYKARIYFPEIGRFLQTDPVGYEDQMNLYAYVHNDPMNNTDPTGEFCVPCLGAAVGFVAEGISIGVDIAGGREVSFAEGAARLGTSTALGAVGAGIAGRAISAVAGAGVKAFAQKAAINVAVAGAANGTNTAARAGIQVGLTGKTDITAGDVAKDFAIGGAAALGGQALSEGVEAIGKAAGALSKNADLAAGGTISSRALAPVVEGAANAIGVNAPSFIPDDDKLRN